jgi:excisionase family DNA binding protein
MRFERKPEYEPKEIKIKVTDVAQQPRPTAIQTEETQTPPEARK